MLLWMIPYSLLYDGLGSKGWDSLTVRIPWTAAMVLAVFRMVFDSGRDKWAGADEDDFFHWNDIFQKDFLGTITGLFVNLFLIYFITFDGVLAYFDGNGWINFNEAGGDRVFYIIVIVVTMVLILIDIFRGIRGWNLADYHGDKE